MFFSKLGYWPLNKTHENIIWKNHFLDLFPPFCPLCTLFFNIHKKFSNDSIFNTLTFLSFYWISSHFNSQSWKFNEKINKIKEPLKGLQPDLSFNKIFINSKGQQKEGTSLLKILNSIITQLSAITCSSDPADIVINFYEFFFVGFIFPKKFHRIMIMDSGKLFTFLIFISCFFRVSKKFCYLRISNKS